MMRSVRNSRRDARLRGDVEFLNRNICFCAPDIPEPDRAVGEAMKMQAETSQKMVGLADKQLAWERDRAAKQDPLIEKIVQQQIKSGEDNAARSDSQWQHYLDLFKPMEERMVKDANEFDSDERKARMAAEAGADVGTAYAATREANERAMGRMGVNPNSGRFQALSNEMALSQAKDTAGAMNKARRDTELQAMAMREGAAKFGRNMPNTGLAADAAALNGGNAAVGNIAAGSQIHNANNAAAMQWFNGANSASMNSANIGLGLHNANLKGAEMQGEAMGGIGSLVGTLGSAAIMGAF